MKYIHRELSKLIGQFECTMILKVVGCCSSVAGAELAKASGPGFDFPVATEIFSHFTFALIFFRPFNLKKINVISICFLMFKYGSL